MPRVPLESPEPGKQDCEILNSSTDFWIREIRILAEGRKGGIERGVVGAKARTYLSSTVWARSANLVRGLAGP